MKSMYFKSLTTIIATLTLFALITWNYGLAEDIRILTLESGFSKLSTLPPGPDKFKDVYFRINVRPEKALYYTASTKVDTIQKVAEFELSASTEGLKTRRLPGDTVSSIAAFSCATECLIRETGKYLDNDDSFFGIVLPSTPLSIGKPLRIDRQIWLNIMVNGKSKRISTNWHSEYKLEGVYTVDGAPHARLILKSKLAGVSKTSGSPTDLTGVGGSRSAVLYYDLESQTVKGTTGVQSIAFQLVGKSQASTVFSSWNIWQK
jgi:hypothetical protein